MTDECKSVLERATAAAKTAPSIQPDTIQSGGSIVQRYKFRATAKEPSYYEVRVRQNADVVHVTENPAPAAGSYSGTDPAPPIPEPINCDFTKAEAKPLLDAIAASLSR